MPLRAADAADPLQVEDLHAGASASGAPRAREQLQNPRDRRRREQREQEVERRAVADGPREGHRGERRVACEQQHEREEAARHEEGADEREHVHRDHVHGLDHVARRARRAGRGRRRPSRRRTSGSRASARPAPRAAPSRPAPRARSRRRARGSSAAARTRRPRSASPASVRSAASSGHGGPFGGSGTSSIQPPRSSVSYVFSLFAFQSARVSVVSTKQPTLASLRAIHGVTMRTAPARTAPAASERAPERPNGQATNAASTSGRSASRALPRIASPSATPEREREQDSLPPLRRDERQQRHDREQQPVEHLAVQVHVVPDEEWVQRRDRRADDARPSSETTRRPISRTTSAVSAASTMCAMPTTSQWRSKTWYSPARNQRVERLRVARGPSREEAESAARDQRLGEAVALLDERREDLAPLGEQHARRGRTAAARTIATARRRVIASVRRTGSLPGRLRVEPRALPELEHEQAPEPVAVVALPAHVLGEQALDRGGPELSARPRAGAEEDVSGELSQRPAEPCAERDPEARLPARGELRRERGARTPGAARPCRRGPESRSESGKRDAELEHLVVEQRRAELERGRHRRAVRLHEQVVREVGARVEQLEAGDAGRGGGPRRAAGGRRGREARARRALRGAARGRPPSARRSARARGAPRSRAGARRGTASSAGCAGRREARAALGRQPGSERHPPMRRASPIAA